LPPDPRSHPPKSVLSSPNWGLCPQTPAPIPSKSVLHPFLFKPIYPNPLSESKLDARFRRYGYFYFLDERKKERKTERQKDEKTKRKKEEKMPGRTNCGSDKWQVGQMTHFMYRSDKWQVGQMAGRTNDAFYV
jgi:hypothetical protein